MRSQGWRSYLVTVAVLALQMSVSVLGTVGMCVDRPHTHGGVPAPDCLMHHAQTDSTAPGTSSHGHHHQHDESTAPDTALGHLSHGFQSSGVVQYYSSLPFNITSGVANLQGTTSRPLADGDHVAELRRAGGNVGPAQRRYWQ